MARLEPGPSGKSQKERISHYAVIRLVLKRKIINKRSHISG